MSGNLTRIKNNQILDSTIWANSKIIAGSIVGSLFNSNITVTSDFTITGNLTVQGSSTYLTVASTNTYVNDPLIVLNNAFSGTNQYDLGFIFNRGSLTNQAFYWDESTDEFKLIATTETGTTYGNIAAETSYSNLRLGNIYLNNYSATRALFMGASGLVTSDADYVYNSTDNVLTVGTLQFRGNTSLISAQGTDQSITLLPSGTGIVDFGGFNAGNLADPLSAQDAVTLLYLQNQLSSAVTNIQDDDTEVRIVDGGVDAGQINANVDATSALVLKSNSVSILGTGYTGSSPKVFVDGANSNVAIASKLFVTDVATLNSRAIISSTVPASTSATGALVVAGGAGIGGNLYVGAGIQNTVIGNVTPAAGYFTNLNATGNLQVATVNASLLSASTAVVGNISAVNFGNTGATFTGASLNVSGNVLASIINATTENLTTLNAGQVNSGFIGNTGAAFTGASINLSGNVLAAGGIYNALTVNGNETVTGYVNVTGNVITAQVTAGTLTATGNVIGGLAQFAAINATPIGNATPAAGTFTVVNSTGNVIGAAATFSSSQINGNENVTGYLNVTGNILGSAGKLSTLTINGTTNATDVTSGVLQVAGGVGIAKDVYIGGNLYVANILSTSYSVLTVNDPLLYLTAANTYPYTYDIGVYSQFTGGTGNLYQHSGVARDHNDAYWKFFSNVGAEPTGTIAFNSDTIYDGVKAGNLVLTDSGIAISAVGFINTTANISGAVVNTGALNVTGTTTLAGINSTGFINTSGNVSAAVGVFGAVNSTGFINTTGNISGAVINGGAINSTGLINTTGNISASQASVGTLNATGLINTTGNISASQASVGTLNATGLINTTGNVSAATVNAATINASGNVLATVFNGGALNVSGNVLASTVGAGFLTASTVAVGNISAVTIGNAGATITGTTGAFSGNVIGGLAQFAAINATPIGNATASTGAFTSLTATSVNSSGNILGTGGILSSLTVNGNESVTGYLNVTGNVLSAGATHNALQVNGDVGLGLTYAAAINTTPIGNATPASGAFTTLSATGTFYANATTDTTSLTTGALITAGGAAIGKTVWIGEGVRINSTQSAESFYVLGQGSGSSLIYADFAKNALVFGGANTAVQDGAVAKFNSTGAIIVPVGSTSQRPGAAGNVDVAGMLRFSSTSNNLEFYDGSQWTAAGSQFTVIATNNFSGNGVQTDFTLSSASTTASTLVMVNGVVQIPVTAYSVSGTTLTFTEAPATGDVVDARTITTTATVNQVASGNGYNTFDVATLPYANVTAGTSSATVRLSIDGVDGTATFTNDVVINGNLTVKGGASGNINIGDQSGDKLQLQGSIVYNQVALSAPGTNLKQLDTFATAAYHTAKYLIQIRDESQIESAEVLLAQDGTNVQITTFAVLSTHPSGALGTFQANISSGSVRLFYTPTLTYNANIKVQTTYIV